MALRIIDEARSLEHHACRDQRRANDAEVVVEENAGQYIETVRRPDRRHLTRLVAPVQPTALDLIADAVRVRRVEPLLRIGLLLPTESCTKEIFGQVSRRIVGRPQDVARS